MSNTDSPDLARLMELARAQAGEPSDWSLATRRAWLERMYAGPEVLVRVWELPTGQLSASAAVRMLAASRLAQPRVVTVTSMLRAGSEELWDEQRAWIDSVLAAGGAEEPSGAVVQVVSEALVDADVARWVSSGFALVFEELAMELDLTPGRSPPALHGPRGAESWNGARCRRRELRRLRGGVQGFAQFSRMDPNRVDGWADRRLVTSSPRRRSAS